MSNEFKIAEITLNYKYKNTVDIIIIDSPNIFITFNMFSYCYNIHFKQIVNKFYSSKCIFVFPGVRTFQICSFAKFTGNFSFAHFFAKELDFANLQFFPDY